MGDYTKHIWERGDTITVDLLNHIENGIEGLENDAATLDSEVVKITDIADNLTSTSAVVPLSANQGKVLKDTITTLDSNLSEQIAEKAPAIMDIQTDYVHTDTDTITFVGNTFAWGNARYANAKNLIDGDTTAPSGTFHDVTYAKSKNGIVLNGTCSAGDDSGFRVGSADIPAGTYIFKIEVHPGNSVLPDTKGFYIDFWYDGNETATQSLQESLYVKYTDQSTTITLTNHVYKIRTWWGVKKDAVYDDYRLFYSLLPSSAVITDTQQAVASTETLDFALPSSMLVVDTLMHESMVAELVDTKTYVDNHIPNIDFVCFRPEDYGAKGDGVTDDSAALQACINAAQTIDNEKGKAIRGYGTYKISTGITFSCRELNVYLHKIIYTGNDAAVTISSSFSRFEFESIRATAGGNNAVGIRCLQSQNSGFYTTFHGNRLKCAFISSNGNTIELVQSSGVTVGSIMYNVFEFNHQTSVNANIIYVNAVDCGENDFYGKIISCQNGYCLYNVQRSPIKLFGYCLETNTKNGIYNGGFIYHYRCRELLDLQTPNDSTKGHLFVIDDQYPWGYADASTFGGADILSVDNTNALSFNQVLANVKEYFENSPSAPAESGWNKVFGVTRGARYPFNYLVIEGVSRTANAYMGGDELQNSNEGTLYAYFDHLGFKPNEEVYYKVTGNTTIQLTSTNNYNYITPTTFDIDTSSANIYLDYSYCAIAINEFDVIQYSGKVAKVYDKAGTLIFDGTNEGPGKFHFKCDMTVLDSLSVTLDNGTVKSVPTSQLSGIYTGSNEKWTITRTPIAATSTDAQAIISSYWG